MLLSIAKNTQTLSNTNKSSRSIRVFYWIWEKTRNKWSITVRWSLEKTDKKCSVSDMSMETKSEEIRASWLEEKKLLSKRLELNLYRGDKLNNKCLCNKIVKVSNFDSIELEGDCIEGSIVNRKRQDISFNFVLRQVVAYFILSEPLEIN